MSPGLRVLTLVHVAISLVAIISGLVVLSKPGTKQLGTRHLRFNPHLSCYRILPSYRRVRSNLVPRYPLTLLGSCPTRVF